MRIPVRWRSGPAAVRTYRAQFRPSPELAAPEASVALLALCADTEERADALTKALYLQLLRFGQGLRGPFPSAAKMATCSAPRSRPAWPTTRAAW
ncbi:hypothetical protein QMK33_21675 [Hymenobacter sp. H14-R3]|uniref:hypothetical protein n=1 Tax=Hymenobacter sp. H14-R3 TaxID=3046308 RepID=UPI0024B88BB1|nr:hypothetical protein [Hymenobacter sp. H14-R3]MDJ0367764.1 hypothetical protein [Hymenobacter sp. H14-R3]